MWASLAMTMRPNLLTGYTHQKLDVLQTNLGVKMASGIRPGKRLLYKMEKAKTQHVG